MATSLKFFQQSFNKCGDFNLIIRCYLLYLNRTRSWELEKARAPHSSTLAWKIPWMEEPGKSGTWLSDFTFNFHFPLSCIGEGNGNPVQCSCLEDPRDGGAWWAAVSGVAQSRTGLKWLSSSSNSSREHEWIGPCDALIFITCCF